MKNKGNIVLQFILLCCLSACKRETIGTYANASLNIVQAMSDNTSLYVFFTRTPSHFYDQQSSLYSAGSLEYTLPPGNTPVSLVSADDTLKTLHAGSLFLKSGGIYSYYLSGQANKIDTLLLQDTIPAISDSAAGIRFINLISGSKPISINLRGGTADHPGLTNIAYQNISAFVNFPANARQTYMFEIRDAGSGLLLTTFQWSYTFQRNNTCIIKGSEDGGNPVQVAAFPVNNF